MRDDVLAQCVVERWQGFLDCFWVGTNTHLIDRGGESLSRKVRDESAHTLVFLVGQTRPCAFAAWHLRPFGASPQKEFARPTVNGGCGFRELP